MSFLGAIDSQIFSMALVLLLKRNGVPFQCKCKFLPLANPSGISWIFLLLFFPSLLQRCQNSSLVRALWEVSNHSAASAEGELSPGTRFGEPSPEIQS